MTAGPRWWLLGRLSLAIAVIAALTLVIAPSEQRVATAAPPNPIIVLHGWRDNCSSFTEMVTWLQINVPTSATCFQYDSKFGMLDAAKKLKWFIQGFNRQLGRAPTAPVDLVAHSFGGLVARTYIETLGNAGASNLVMLGTPNTGSWAARLASKIPWFGLSDKAAWELRPNSPELTQLNTKLTSGQTNRHGTLYWVIAGAGDNSLVYDEDSYPNDCIVTTDSAKGSDINPPLNFKTLTLDNVVHTSGACGADQQFGTISMTTQASGVFGWVKDMLVGNVNPNSLPDPPTPEEQRSHLVGVFAGTALPGGMDNFQVNMDSQTRASFALSWQVTDPNSLASQPNSLVLIANAPSSGGGSGFANTSSFGLWTARYTAPTPQPGTWQVSVWGLNNTPPTGINYQVSVFGETTQPQTAYFDTDAFAHAVGQSVPIRLFTSAAGVPITGGSASVDVAHPGSPSLTIPLQDVANNGIYQGQFSVSDPTQIGEYILTGSFSAPGGFQRFDVMTLMVCKSVIGLDCDLDGDGFVDDAEAFLGTNTNMACAATAPRNNEPPPDAWPFDFDDSQTANGSDLLTFAPVFGGVSPNPPYNARFDLNADLRINGSDLLMFAPVFYKTCA